MGQGIDSLIYFQQRNVVGHDLAAIGKKPLPGLTIGLNDIVGSITNVDSIGFMMEIRLETTIRSATSGLTMAAEDSILSPITADDEFVSGSSEWPGKSLNPSTLMYHGKLRKVFCSERFQDFQIWRIP